MDLDSKPWQEFAICELANKDGGDLTEGGREDPDDDTLLENDWEDTDDEELPDEERDNPDDE